MISSENHDNINDMSTSSPASRVKGPIGLVMTGGTIASEVNSGIADVSAGPEMGLVQTAAAAGTEIRVAHAMSKLSENMQPDDWISIAQAVRRLVDKEQVEGVLILHGTDTMGFTSAALSFLLADLDLPIVLTGANVPPLEPQSDAETNIKDAVFALSSLKSNGMTGTFVCFSGVPDQPSQLLAGVNVRKSIAAGRAYESVNRGPIASVSCQSFELQGDMPPHHPIPDANLRIDPAVRFLRVLPGVNFAIEADTTVKNGYRGVVIELYPGWTGPVNTREHSLAFFIDQVARAGAVVAMTVPHASTHGYEYASESVLRNSSAVVLERALPETAYVKLMWALAQYSEPARVQELMRKNIAGELGNPGQSGDTKDTTAA
jgi:L-asparaginase/Glu-tRNA(Gln) amidotransferase subunit D